MISEEAVEKNFEILRKLIDELPESRKSAFINLLNYCDTRIAMAPYSGREEYGCAYTGGLVKYTLTCIKYLRNLSKTLCPDKYSNDTLFVVGFLHELGKIGDLTQDLFVPQTSDWHRERGMYYEFNSEISYMKVPHRSLFLAQHFGIQLSNEEYLAILLSEGQADEANAHYKYKENELALLLSTARLWAINSLK